MRVKILIIAMTSIRLSIWLVGFGLFTLALVYGLNHLHQLVELREYVRTENEFSSYYGSGGSARVVSIMLPVFMLAYLFSGWSDFPKFRPFFQLFRGLCASVFVVFFPPIVLNFSRYIESGIFDGFYARRGPWLIDAISDENGHRTAIYIGLHVAVGIVVFSFDWFFPNGPRRSMLGLVYRYGLVLIVVPAIYISFFTLGVRIGWDRL